MNRRYVAVLIAAISALTFVSVARAEKSVLRAPEASEAAACAAAKSQGKKCNRWYNLDEKASPDACVTAKQHGTKCSRWYSVGAPAPAPKEEVIVLRGINFDTAKADIKPESIPILESNVKGLQKRPHSHITIEGHTDSRGGAAYNQRLSEARANSVLNWFADHGIDRGRMNAVGRGFSMPVADNKTAEGQYQNRRIELHIN